MVSVLPDFHRDRALTKSERYCYGRNGNTVLLQTTVQGKVPLWVWAHNLRAGTVTKCCKETLRTLP